MSNWWIRIKDLFISNPLLAHRFYHACSYANPNGYLFMNYKLSKNLSRLVLISNVHFTKFLMLQNYFDALTCQKSLFLMDSQCVKTSYEFGAKWVSSTLVPKLSNHVDFMLLPIIFLIICFKNYCVSLSKWSRRH